MNCIHKQQQLLKSWSHSHFEHNHALAWTTAVDHDHRKTVPFWSRDTDKRSIAPLPSKNDELMFDFAKKGAEGGALGRVAEGIVEDEGEQRVVKEDREVGGGGPGGLQRGSQRQITAIPPKKYYIFQINFLSDFPSMFPCSDSYSYAPLFFTFAFPSLSFSRYDPSRFPLASPPMSLRPGRARLSVQAGNTTPGPEPGDRIETPPLTGGANVEEMKWERTRGMKCG